MMHFVTEVFLIIAISVEPDEMQHIAAFHLGLHCKNKINLVPKYQFMGFPEHKRLSMKQSLNKTSIICVL